MKKVVKDRRAALKRKETITCYLVLLFPIIGFLIFTLYPMLWAGRISFFSYDGLHTNFIGSSNYKSIFKDTNFWASWGNNLKVMIIKTPVEALLAFVTANVLMDRTKFSGIFRAIYYLPGIISTAIVALVFSNMFQYFGVFNTYLMKWGIIEKNIDWLSSTNTAFIMVFIVTLWMSFGGSVLYYQAALSTVPKELIESARLDGANAFAVTFKVKLPLILPTLQVLMLLSLNGCLHLGEIVLLLTGGSPGGKSYTISAYLMSRIVPGMGDKADVGYAAAMSIVVSIICCLCALAFNKLTKKLKSIY